MNRMYVTTTGAAIDNVMAMIVVGFSPWWVVTTKIGWFLGIDRVNGYFLLPAAVIALSVYLYARRAFWALTFTAWAAFFIGAAYFL